MKRNNRNTLSTVLAMAFMLVATSLHAQPSVGCDQYRPRLIPYPTASDAQARSLERQRYMQPITEWQRPETTVLQAKYTFPFSWLERQVYLRVEDAYQPYEVYINGKLAGSSRNGFGAAEFNITKLSREDLNDVEIRLLSAEEVNKIECFARGANTPKAYVISQPRVRVRDITWSAEIGQNGVANSNFEVVMHNATLGDKVSTLYYELYLNDTIRLGGGRRDVALGKYGVDTMRFGVAVPDSIMWSSAKPQHVRLMLKNRVEGRDVEFYDFPVALRQLSYEGGKFYINNSAEPIDFYAMSPASTIADVAKAYERGVRNIRFTAGCVDDTVLDYCDQQGIYVAVTAPIDSSSSGGSRKRGGNPSNDTMWRGDYVERTLQMFYTTKRHPSVIAYVLADNSSNGICLYESYLALKAVVKDRPVFYYDGGKEWNTDHLK